MNFIYHSKDLDGLCCGALALMNNDKSVLQGYHYNEPFDVRTFKNKVVGMADVSLPPEKIISLAKVAKELRWYDHHISAYDGFIEYLEEKNIPYDLLQISEIVIRIELKELNMIYFFSPKYSAAELYYFVEGLFEKVNIRVYEIVSLLGQYDTWRNNDEKKLHYDKDWDSVVIPFQYGMRVFTTPKEIYQNLYLINQEDIINKGKLVLNYQKEQNKKAMNNSFVININGIKILACNGVPFNSGSFESVYDLYEHDAMLPFVFDGKNNCWNYSLYTEKDSDVLSIAKSYGGGGHAQACGFTTKDLLLEIQTYHEKTNE